MAVIYVNKSGSDANNGTTPTLAKLTIAGAHSIAVSGDTISIGAGTYIEAAPLGVAQGRYLRFEANGRVIWSGNGTSTHAVELTGSINASFYGIIFTGFTVAAVRAENPSALILVMTFHKCTFRDMAGASGITMGNNGTVLGEINVIDCDFYNMAIGVQNKVNASGSVAWEWRIIGNTFASLSGAALVWGGTGLYTAKVNGCYHNIFKNCDRAHDYGASALGPVNVSLPWNRNLYHGMTTSIGRISSTEYTTLAAWQTALGSSREANSSEADPALRNIGKGDLSFLATSPAATLALSGGYVGAIPVSFSRSNVDAEWTIGDTLASGAGTQWVRSAAGIALNGSGEFEYSGTGAITLTSPVWDLATADKTWRIDLGVTETYPGRVIDYDITDVRPNRTTLEYRTQATSFNQDAGSPSWSSAEWGPWRDAALQLQRYVQVRLTFRDNGVAA